ncbi:hypothetical protein, partial [uncultured Bacteroides sp.]
VSGAILVVEVARGCDWEGCCALLMPLVAASRRHSRKIESLSFISLSGGLRACLNFVRYSQKKLSKNFFKQNLNKPLNVR